MLQVKFTFAPSVPALTSVRPLSNWYKKQPSGAVENKIQKGSLPSNITLDCEQKILTVLP